MDDSARRRALCLSVVRPLHQARQWTLLTPEELAERVLALTPPASTAEQLAALARDRYSRELYAACAQDGDLARREQAFRELHAWLFRAAQRRRPELAEDAAQRAIELVFQHLPSCREPGAFAFFALGKLRQALTEQSRPRARAIEREAPLVAGEIVEVSQQTADLAEQREQLRAIAAALARLPDQRQREAVVLKFFGGLSDQAIGARLAITPTSVRVLRYRALERLRRDPQFLSSIDDGL